MGQGILGWQGTTFKLSPACRRHDTDQEESSLELYQRRRPRRMLPVGVEQQPPGLSPLQKLQMQLARCSEHSGTGQFNSVGAHENPNMAFPTHTNPLHDRERFLSSSTAAVGQ